MAFATPNCYLASQPLNSSSNSCNRPQRPLLHATMSLSNPKPKPPTKTAAAATTAIAPTPISSSSTATILTPESHTMTPKHCSRKGSDVLVEALEREGVTHVFAYPGGATMEIHQSLTHPSTQITTILPRHEQGGIFAAEGYARASGRPGVCIATSGPGATNLISGLADAMLDSIPLVAITGQVPRHLIGTDAFQEVPIVEITKSITKHNFLVLKAEDISSVVREAFFIATSGRPGPVLIDIPKDVQQEMVVSGWDTPLDINGYMSRLPKSPEQEPLEKITALISESKKPVLYVGGGCVNSSEELKEFVELTGIPVASTLMGLGNFPGNHELSLGMLGMHGTMYANYAVDRSDLLLAFGVRFDDRVTGKIDKFASRAKIVHIDIDPAEIGKNKQPDVSICGDIKLALREINDSLENRIKPLDFSAWKNELNEYRNRNPLRYKTFGEEILPQHAIQTLQELTNGSAIISTGVGQHQMFAAQYYNFNGPRQWLSSSGLGAMGFGLPAAIGAALARPDATVIDIDGDGSFMMNVQELATVRVENLPVKIMILNNQHLGMVVQWEDRFYKSNRAHTYLGNDGGGSGDVFPDMLKFAEACGIPAARVSKRSEMKEAVEKMMETPGPYLLDVIVPHQEHVLPMIPSGGSFGDVIC